MTRRVLNDPRSVRDGYGSSCSRISGPHNDFVCRQLQWRRVRDVIEGSDRVKNQGNLYLPKPSGMRPNDYAAYKLRASFFPAAERTMRGMIGMVFRHAPKMKIPAKLEPWKEAMTSDFTPMGIALEEMVGEVLTVGRYGLFLDFPKGARVGDLPHVIPYQGEDILDWNESIINGKRVLSRVLLVERSENEAVEDRRLELFLDENGHYAYSIWTRVKRKGVKSDLLGDLTGFTRIEMNPFLVNGKPVEHIPFWFMNPYDMRPRADKPPYLDLVDKVLEHYVLSADYKHTLYLTSCPTPWMSGKFEVGEAAKRPRTIGSATIWYLPENGQCGFAEFSGAGAEAQRTALQDLETQMLALGARMIADAIVRNESTDTARMRGRSETSLLMSIVNIVSATILDVLNTAAEWVGTSEKCEFELNKDFVETRMTPQELKELIAAWMAGAISRQTLHENLQSGEIVKPDRTLEDEVGLIEAEGGDPTPPTAIAKDKRETEKQAALNPPEPNPADAQQAQQGGGRGAVAR